jgi:hypothetical protein
MNQDIILASRATDSRYRISSVFVKLSIMQIVTKEKFDEIEIRM